MVQTKYLLAVMSAIGCAAEFCGLAGSKASGYEE
jgi:hypothetical protein